MRRFTALSALILLAASAAKAQDTTVVIVRHLPQDTVVVRHLGPADSASVVTRRQPPRRMAPPEGPPYGTRYPSRTANNGANNGVIAKDPNIGSLLSFVFPGGAQYYADQTGKGLAITMLAIGAPIIGYANVHRERDYLAQPAIYPPCQSGTFGGCGPQYRDRTDWTPAAIGLTVGIGSWLYGIATAGTDVAKWNKAHNVRFVNAPGRYGFAVPFP